MINETYNYKKIQELLNEKGWYGSISDLELIISTSQNELTILNFIKSLENIILKPCYDEIKPNFYNSSDRIELFEKAKQMILSSYNEPCSVEKFETDLYKDITINSENLNITFSIEGSSFRINESKPEITVIDFSK